MKVDFDVLRALEKSGASLAMGISYLEQQHLAEEEKRKTKRLQDAARQRKHREKIRRESRVTGRDTHVTDGDSRRLAATLSDTPRARLFREGSAAMNSLGFKTGRARALIATWLNFTNDDEQLVLATILNAQSLAVADAAGWILATLKGKCANERTDKGRPNGAHDNIRAGMADALAERLGGRLSTPEDNREPSFELGTAEFRRVPG